MISFSLRRLASAVILTGAALLVCANDAAALTFNTIHTFTAQTEGNVTYPPLVQGADGRLYGVNSTGGRSDNGTIFSLSTGGGNFLTLNTFTQSNQGTTPQGGIVQARDGYFYGTTNTGGNGGYGTFYQCDPSSGKLNILAQFTNGNPGGSPVGTVTEGIDGGIYGTARYGGDNNYGTIYRANLPTGTVVTFAQITGGLAGFYPQSDLIQATDSNFYGTTEKGGTYGNGTFFQVTPAGVYTVIYSFTGGSDGSRPLRGVVQGIDGSFYGICNQGGDYGGGAIFRIDYLNTTFKLTVLHAFVPIALDGSNALGGLVQASDGNFYGTTSAGGASSNGTVFRITSTGGYDVLYSFTNGIDGAAPVAGLTQANDGKLYGTTAGTNGQLGTVFRVDLGLSAPLPRPRYFLQASATTGDTILVKGDNFVGTTAVSFAGANGGTVAATSFSVLSKTVVQAVVPDGAVTGAVVVTANGLSGTTPGALNITTVVTPPPVTISSVSILASRPVASKSDSREGRFQIARAGGDFTQPLMVKYSVRSKSTAILGTDYNLVAKGKPLGLIGTVTIPAGKASIAIKVIPIPSSTPAPATIIVMKVAKSDTYDLAAPVKATVQVASSDVSQ